MEGLHSPWRHKGRWPPVSACDLRLSIGGKLSLFLRRAPAHGGVMRSPQAKAKKSGSLPDGLPKCPTGIHGLDEITFGGLPRGRPTLVCGGAGCGKTLLGMEFLVRGATDFDEPGVCLSFEETAEELATNVASLGFDVAALIARKKLAIDHVYLERSLIEETGEYDLEALFVRLGHAVDSIGAKRVLLDSVEALFAGLDNEAILRSELRRLFRWLKEKKLTAIVTGERGQGTPDPPRPGRIHFGLRHPARPPGHRDGPDAAPARRQIPRLHARDQRVSVPDRRATAFPCCR